jgi:large subunit ribosomal protein L23
MNNYDLIRRPLVTEKNTYHAERNIYAFEVTQAATKVEIRHAVEKVFGVKVVGVRTMICRDRQRRTAKSLSRVSYWKKALVELAEGQKIKLFEGA